MCPLHHYKHTHTVALLPQIWTRASYIMAKGNNLKQKYFYNLFVTDYCVWSVLWKVIFGRNQHMGTERW